MRRTIFLLSTCIALAPLALRPAWGQAARGADDNHVAKEASEPFLERFSPAKAGAYLDARVHAHEKNCLACHATYAYLVARPAISPTSAVHREARQALERLAVRLTLEQPNRKNATPKQVTAAVMTAAVLAQHDAATQGKLDPLTRQALDRIWDLQRDDGGWNWTKAGEPPSALDDHFGVTMAVLGVAAAPDGYAHSPQARAGLDRVRRYLHGHSPTTMHQRAMLLLAAANLDGLVSDAERQRSAADLFALQRPDGGWAMAGLGDWKRPDGWPLERTASDGYGTGFAVYVLRRGAGISAHDPRLQKGLVWLKTHQRTSGCWFTPSPHKNDEISSFEGTVYAILALNACGEIAAPPGER
jgi:squalene-hopene/tetraprenyl-beta-curcumene cyclase